LQKKESYLQMDKNNQHINFSSNGSNNDFELPKNYFDEMQLEIKAKIIEEKLKALVTNSNDFKVPQGYFKQLQSHIPLKKKTPIVSLISSRVIKYAAAVAIILTLGIIGYQTYSTTSTADEFLLADNFATTSVEDYFNDLTEDQTTIELIEYSEETNAPVTKEQNTTVKEVEDIIDDPITIDPTDLLEIEEEDFDIL